MQDEPALHQEQALVTSKHLGAVANSRLNVLVAAGMVEAARVLETRLPLLGVRVYVLHLHEVWCANQREESAPGTGLSLSLAVTQLPLLLLVMLYPLIHLDIPVD